MDSISFFIGAAALAACVLPFYIVYLLNNKKRNQRLKEFMEQGYKYGIEISEHLAWRNKLIGLDPVKKKILYQEQHNGGLNETLVDLNNVSSCNVYKTVLNEAGGMQLTDQVELIFKTRDNREIRLLFYDSDQDVNLEDELIECNHWATHCKGLLQKTKPQTTLA